MTTEAARAAGALLVSKDQLFEQADIVTIHSRVLEHIRAEAEAESR